MGPHVGQPGDARLEQGHGNPRLEGRARRDCHRHQPLVGAEEEQLATVGPPLRVGAAAGGNQRSRGQARVILHVDVGPPGLVRGVRESSARPGTPAPVRR